MEIKPGGSKLGPPAPRGNLSREETYWNTALFYCHTRDEAGVNNPHSKSRVCIIEGDKK